MPFTVRGKWAVDYILMSYIKFNKAVTTFEVSKQQLFTCADVYLEKRHVGLKVHELKRLISTIFREECSWGFLARTRSKEMEA